jgi:DNA-binding MltR family transcriptional regulator
MTVESTTPIEAPEPSKAALEAAHEFLVSAAMKAADKIALDKAKDVLPFFEGLLAESDRASGILSFAFIEAQIGEIFSQHLDKDTPGGVQSIIGQNGILDSVGSRLKMLRALNWLGDKTFDDLRLLARIRNRFAHSPIALSYHDNTIRGYFSSLQRHEDKFTEKYSDVPLSMKHTYLVRAAMTLSNMYADLVLRPSSLTVGFGATGAFSANFDQYPIQLRHALAWCVDTVFAIYAHAKNQHQTGD